MLGLQEFIEKTQFQKICKKLLEEPEIRFAGIIDWMGNLMVGDFRKDVIPLKDESERKKMFMEAVLRVRTRQEFDYNMGSVEYAAARRKKNCNNDLSVKRWNFVYLDKL